MDYSKKVLMDNIYYLAKKNNITLGKLEELAGLSAGYLSRLNSGNNNSNPSIDAVSSFSKQLNVPIDILTSHKLDEITPDEEYMFRFIYKLMDKTQANELHWEADTQAFFEAVEQREAYHPFFIEENYQAYYYSRFLQGESASVIDEAYRLTINRNDELYLFKIKTNDPEGEMYYELYLDNGNQGHNIEPLCNAKFSNKTGLFFDVLNKLYQIASESSKKVSLKSSVKSSIEAFMNDEILDREYFDPTHFSEDPDDDELPF